MPARYNLLDGAFSDILHTNPHLVGRSHPVSVEVREFDWDSSRKGASQLSRTKTIRLSTPKTTTGEILFFALTSPLNHHPFLRPYIHQRKCSQYIARRFVHFQTSFDRFIYVPGLFPAHVLTKFSFVALKIASVNLILLISLCDGVESRRSYRVRKSPMF